MHELIYKILILW